MTDDYMGPPRFPRRPRPVAYVCRVVAAIVLAGLGLALAFAAAADWIRGLTQ